MLKLLIVDDEEIICSTIAKVIDWKELNIALIGTCLDGVEAYHTILDESPDIVMTDIRMPGISGLELIERISHTNLDTQFIILSGYGEFEYAKRAMRCGVRHYLLKPCEKEQIISCVKEVIKDCQELRRSKELENHDNQLSNSLRYTLIQNIISEGISLPEINDSFFAAYEKYLDFTDTAYQYCCIYYLEQEYLKDCLRTISGYFDQHAPQLMLYNMYITNILILFFPNYSQDYREMDNFLGTLSFPGQQVSIKYERTSYPSLKALLTTQIRKLKRYDRLYFAVEGRLIPCFNYEHISTHAKNLCPLLVSPNEQQRQNAFEELKRILSSASSLEFLMQLSSQVLITVSSEISSCTITQITEFLSTLQLEKNQAAVCSKVLEKLEEIMVTTQKRSNSYSPVVEELLNYLDNHVSDSNLTLKWIAENHLYMNVNYVSRCFVKETQQKFSSYLMNLRVQKAKEILAGNDEEKIQNVAELVGCGNNPYYFSKIFKKCTGMTPSAYVRKIKNNPAGRSGS